MSAITDFVGGIISGFFGSAGKTAIDIETAVKGISPGDAAALEKQKGDILILTANLKAQADQAQANLEKAQGDYWTATLGVTGSNFFKFFVAGPKPALFWVCVFAFALQFGVQPVINWIIASIAAIAQIAKPFQLAAIDMNLPTQIVIGGMGLTSTVVRGVEKMTNSAGNH